MTLYFSNSNLDTNNLLIGASFYSNSQTRGIIFGASSDSRNYYSVEMNSSASYQSNLVVKRVTNNSASILACSQKLNLLLGGYYEIELLTNGNWINAEFNKLPILSCYIDNPYFGQYYGFITGDGTSDTNKEIINPYLPKLNTSIERFSINIGDTSQNLLRNAVRNDNAYFWYDYQNNLNIKKLVRKQSSASLIDQILSIQKDYSDKDIVNRVIVSSDNYKTYINDISSLQSGSGINEVRTDILRISTVDSLTSCSTIAQTEIDMRKRYSKQYTLRTWGLPDIGMYDTVLFSNSKLGVTDTYRVYNINNRFSANGTFENTFSIGEQ